MDHAIIKRLISYIIILSIFLTGTRFQAPGFVVYWYYPVYLIFLVLSFIINRRISGRLLILIVGVFLYTMLTMSYDGLNLFVKQFINIVFSLLVFYNFIVFEKYDLIEIFRKYINVAKIVLLIGFMQVILVRMGLETIYFKMFPFIETARVDARLQSISDEPSFIALTFIPVVFLSLYNLIKRKNYLIGKIWSMLFIFGYILTFSSLAYLAVLIMLLQLYFQNFGVRKFVNVAIGLGVIFAAGWIMYWKVPDVKSRIDDTLTAFTVDIDDEEKFKSIHLSSYAWVSNWYVTRKTVAEHPITGRGLGSYELAYDKHMPTRLRNYYELNRQDANSLALRLVAETGIIGLGLFLYFVFRFRVRSHRGFSYEQELFWILNAGILTFILLSLFRNGNYTIHGKLLFFLIYYLSYNEVKRLYTTPSEELK